jgi:predicted HD superfamily hydrolase involved in NAD metabolism
MAKKLTKKIEKRFKHKKHRYTHILGVKDTAVALGKEYDLDVKKLKIAALLHDYTKYYSYTKNKKIIKKHYENPKEILKDYSKGILHAFSARVIAQEKFGIDDTDILDAILHHTVGKPAMTMYEKIIFISDYIEPGRTYKSCIKVREIAKDNLDKAVYEALNDTITFHEKKGSKSPKIAYEARQYYKSILEEQNG